MMNLIRKLLIEAQETCGTYAEFVVSADNISFTSDCGSRRSTRNYRLSKDEIKKAEKTLRGLSDRCLLFSNYLCRISYSLSDGRTGYIQRDRADKGINCHIVARKTSESVEKSHDYVRFISYESLYAGIAFAVKTNRSGSWQICPCSGEILNHGITSDLDTDLSFILSGTFFTRNGEFDPKYDSENHLAIDELADMLRQVLMESIHSGINGMLLYSLLPNTMDEESLLNVKLIEAVKEVCRSFPIFRTRNGRYVTRNNIAYGTDEVTTQFPQEIIDKIWGNRYWIEPCSPGSREEYFLLDVGVPYYDRERFLKDLFIEDLFDELSEILKTRNDKWLRAFYVFCAEPVEDESTRRQIITGLQNIRSIRDSKGRMYYLYEIAVADNSEDIDKKAIYVKPSIISPRGEEDEFSELLRAFFTNELGIKEYSLASEMKDLAILMMTKKLPVDKSYLNRMLTLAKYDRSHPGEIDFGQYAIFPYKSSRGVRRTKASDLVVGKPYIREGQLLASATGRMPIWEGLIDILNESDINTILEFAVRYGAIGEPVVVQQPATAHRDFRRCLYVEGKPGRRDSNYDYTIPGLDEILKRRSTRLSKLIWSAILSCKYDDEVVYAEYSTGNRSFVNRCDSSLILMLRERAWVPGIDGKLYPPENIAISDIHPDLQYDKHNVILKALRFGTGTKKREKTIKEIEKLAAKQGLRLVPDTEYQEYLRWKSNSAEGIQ